MGMGRTPIQFPHNLPIFSKWSTPKVQRNFEKSLKIYGNKNLEKKNKENPWSSCIQYYSRNDFGYPITRFSGTRHITITTAVMRKMRNIQLAREVVVSKNISQTCEPCELLGSVLELSFVLQKLNFPKFLLL